MANILDLANCASVDTVFNTGTPLCDLSKKKMKGVILADSGVVFSGADISSVSTFIQALRVATTAPRGGRVYPIWDIVNFEDATGDPATGGVGNLTTATIITNDAVPVFRFGYNGTEARHKRVSAMASMNLSVFFVDEGFTVYGTDRNGAFAGYTILQAYAYTSKFIVADAVNQYSFRVTLANISEYRDASRYVVTNNTIITNTVGLIDVNQLILSNTANAYRVQPVADGGTNLVDLYGAALAALPFTARNLQTNTTIAVTSVVLDAANHALVITLDSTAYGALAVGDRVQVFGPSSAALAAANIRPFEFISLIITK